MKKLMILAVALAATCGAVAPAGAQGFHNDRGFGMGRMERMDRMERHERHAMRREMMERRMERHERHAMRREMMQRRMERHRSM